MDDKQSNELVVVEQIRKMPTEPNKVSLRQQAGNLFVSIFKCAPFVGHPLAEVVSQIIKTGEYSPEQRLRNLQFDWLVEGLPSILKRVERLLNEGVRVESPDIGAIFEAALDASRKTTGKKREYLKKALENAFSLRMYEEGQILRFFRILGELEYGDIYLLQIYVETNTEYIHSHYSNDGATLRHVMAEEHDGTYVPEAIDNNALFHGAMLREHHLVHEIATGWKIADIARDFIWFVTADDEDLEDDGE